MSEESQRLDKWLWHARFCKHRTFATTLCAAGRVRVNSMLTTKAHQPVRTGDVLTLPVGPGAFAAIPACRDSTGDAPPLKDTVAIVRILALAPRRGPAAQARALYQVLSDVDGRPIGDDLPFTHGSPSMPADIPDGSGVE